MVYVLDEQFSIKTEIEITHVQVKSNSLYWCIVKFNQIQHREQPKCEAKSQM